jgi:hypothetical protein
LHSAICQSARGAYSIVKSEIFVRYTGKRKALEEPALLDRKPAARQKRVRAEHTETRTEDSKEEQSPVE